MISAFDRVLGTVPYRGQVLNQLAAWWFERIADLVPSHLLSVPDPNVTIGREVPHAAGRGRRAGPALGLDVDGAVDPLRRGRARDLRPAIPRRHGGRTTPFPRRSSRRPRRPSRAVTTSRSPRPGSSSRASSRPSVGTRSARRRSPSSSGVGSWRPRPGLVLVDTKYEFGVDDEGRLTIIDEVHTPDSSRYWRAATVDERLRRRARSRRTSTRRSSGSSTPSAATAARATRRRSIAELADDRRRCLPGDLRGAHRSAAGARCVSGGATGRSRDPSPPRDERPPGFRRKSSPVGCAMAREDADWSGNSGGRPRE